MALAARVIWASCSGPVSAAARSRGRPVWACWRVAQRRRAQTLSRQPAAHGVPARPRLRDQGALGVRAGAPAAQAGVRPGSLRGAPLDRAAPARAGGLHGVCPPAAPAPRRAALDGAGEKRRVAFRGRSVVRLAGTGFGHHPVLNRPGSVIMVASTSLPLGISRSYELRSSERSALATHQDCTECSQRQASAISRSRRNIMISC